MPEHFAAHLDAFKRKLVDQIAHQDFTSPSSSLQIRNQTFEPSWRLKLLEPAFGNDARNLDAANLPLLRNALIRALCDS
ncbi:MAG: hypothetical protein ACRYGK_02775, partial [Janthinobacterium lividum]